MIPHRRGDDGYFMLQLTPPTTAESPTREVLPDGEPLELVILADTSASMDAASRTAQAEFIAALLASLTPRTRSTWPPATWTATGSSTSRCRPKKAMFSRGASALRRSVRLAGPTWTRRSPRP